MPKSKNSHAINKTPIQPGGKKAKRPRSHMGEQMPLAGEPAVVLLQGQHTPFSPIVAQDPQHTRTFVHLSE